jgi:hypothetical protein
MKFDIWLVVLAVVEWLLLRARNSMIRTRVYPDQLNTPLFVLAQRSNGSLGGQLLITRVLFAGVIVAGLYLSIYPLGVLLITAFAVFVFRIHPNKFGPGFSLAQTAQTGKPARTIWF